MMSIKKMTAKTDKPIVLFLFLLLCIPFLSSSQQRDTLIHKLDSLSKKADSAGRQVNNTSPHSYDDATRITFSSFFTLEFSNLKQAFTKPFHMTGRDWGKVGEFALVSGALAFADEPVQHRALDIRSHNRTLRNISTQVTEFGGTYEGYTLGALGAYGFLFKNKKMQTTTLLAVQAYATGAALQGVLKLLSGRQRPEAVSSSEAGPDPRFWGPFHTNRDAQGNKLSSAYPSGHTTVAFAAATVYAMEYKEKWPWVPWIAYPAATLIGLSRITENKHWLTDVVGGAALGYLTGRLVVNNYHRYAKLKSPKLNKNSVSFSVGYNYGQITPGLIYHMR